MKAAVHTRYGPPEVVRVIDVDEPVANDDQLLVKVHATTINRTDCHYRAAKPFFMRFVSGLAKPRATILGTEFAGEVAAIGPDVVSFKVGDRVFGYVEGPFGAHAEYLVIPETGLVAAMPANLTYQEAAPGTEGSHYALAHIRRAKIGPGQDILVYGATGGIGSAAVQLLKCLGARVTAVCDTKNVALVRSLGADKVIDYTAQDFSSESQAYDVVFDAVGKTSFRRCKRMLKPGGIFMSTGPGPGYQNLMLPVITPLLPRQEGAVCLSAFRSGGIAVYRRADGVRGVQASHPPRVPALPDRRGVQVRRSRPEDRQRRDQRRSRLAR